MSKTEIAQKVAEIHNSLINIPVSGDNVIVMAGALIELRQLVQGLQEDIRNEAEADAGEDGSAAK